MTFASLLAAGYAPQHVDGRLVGGVPHGRDTLELECGAGVWIHASPRIGWRLMPEDFEGAP